MIAGLETITAGTVVIADRVVNNLEPRERDIAMVFQNYALYPHMTVFANMAYSLKIAGIDKKEIEKRIDENGPSARAGTFSQTQAQSTFRWSATESGHGPGYCSQPCGLSF